VAPVRWRKQAPLPPARQACSGLALALAQPPSKWQPGFIPTLQVGEQPREARPGRAELPGVEERVGTGHTAGKTRPATTPGPQDACRVEPAMTTPAGCVRVCTPARTGGLCVHTYSCVHMYTVGEEDFAAVCLCVTWAVCMRPCMPVRHIWGRMGGAGCLCETHR
jgi:hypothetical protein